MDSNNLVPVKIAQLVKEFPFMNWTVFFQSAFNAIDNTFSIDQDTEILIQVIADPLNQYQGCSDRPAQPVWAGLDLEVRPVLSYFFYKNVGNYVTTFC